MKMTSRRRRTKAQIAKDKLDAQEKETYTIKKLSQMDELEKQMKKMQTQLDQAEALNGKVADMFRQGKLKEEPDGVINVVENPQERKMLFLSQQEDEDSQNQAVAIQQELQSQIQSKAHQPKDM